MSVGHAALIVVDVEALLQAWLTVAALSFEAAAADPIALDPRIHSAAHRAGQSAIAAEMRARLRGLEERSERPGALGIQDPYPFRALPQVDGAVHDALRALRETVIHELNFAGENALIVSSEPAALPNGNPHAAPLANAIDNLRTALAQSAALIAARVSALLDPSLTGLPAVPRRAARAGVRRPRCRVHRARGRSRGALARHSGRRPDGVGLPRRRVALEPRTDRRPPRP